jgi:putative hydrolase of the HAD superfamily
MAVPRLAEREPFFALDPARLEQPPRQAASISGASRSARRVMLDELEPVGLVVMGCVAVGEDGARLGKGGGFAEIDIGGVLIPGYLPAAAAEWGPRLGISPQAFLTALFGGSDDQVLTGRVSEPRWWAVVARRLQADPGLMAELQQDLASREVWDSILIAHLRRLRGRARTAIVSNAWPGTRARMSRAGVLDIAEEIVLSSEIGYAKPDPRIYTATLQRLAVSPGHALFIEAGPGGRACGQSCRAVPR